MFYVLKVNVYDHGVFGLFEGKRAANVCAKKLSSLDDGFHAWETHEIELNKTVDYEVRAAYALNVTFTKSSRVAAFKKGVKLKC